MKVLPSDPDKRWNRIVGYTSLALGAWIMLILASVIWGVNEDVQDDALLIGAAAGFATVLLGQYRHGQKVDQVVNAVNHVEDDERSLAQTLHSIDRKLDELLEKPRN